MEITHVVTAAFVMALVGYFFLLGRRVSRTRGTARAERPWSEAWVLEAVRDLGRGIAATAAMGRPLPDEQPTRHRPSEPVAQSAAKFCGQA